MCIRDSLLRDEQIQVVEPVRSVFHQNGELRLGPHIGGGADREQSQTCLLYTSTVETFAMETIQALGNLR